MIAPASFSLWTDPTAAFDHRIGCFGFGQRGLLPELDEGIELWIELLNAIKMRTDQFPRRELSLSNHLGNLKRREPRHLGTIAGNCGSAFGLRG